MGWLFFVVPSTALIRHGRTRDTFHIYIAHCSPTQLRFGAVGSDVGQINEVTLCRARLVLGWVTAGNLSQSNQPPRSTQPGHPSVGRGNEYQSKGGDAL